MVAPRLNASFREPPSLSIHLINDDDETITQTQTSGHAILGQTFHAGQDLLLLRTLNGSIAKLYKYFGIEYMMSNLIRDQHSWVALLLLTESNGDVNSFL